MKKDFIKEKLPNGITLLYEKRNVPVVSIGISIPFGSAYETEEIKGAAHFLEHLLFTGTKSRSSEEISREIDSVGGIVNAFTHNQMTCFWVKMPSEYGILGLEILQDMLNNPIFPEEKFEKEKKVILEEIKMYHDDPRTHISSEQIYKNMFDSPFGSSYIIGSEKTIKELTREKIIEIYKKNYNPKNFVVSMVGDIDLESVKKFLQEKFKSGNEKMYDLIKIKKKNEESLEERSGIDQAHFLMGFHAPLPSTKEYYALQILNAYLTVGMSSKLFIEIREKRGLAYTVSGSIEAERDYSVYSIYVGTRKESLPEVKKIIIGEISNIKSMGEKDLENMKKLLIGHRKIKTEESINVMESLIYSELNSKAEEFYKYEENINNVKLAELINLSKKLIENHSSATIIPKKT